MQLALQTLPVIERVPKQDLLVVIDYSAMTPFKRLLADFEVETLQEEFAADVTLTLRLPEVQGSRGSRVTCSSREIKYEFTTHYAPRTTIQIPNTGHLDIYEKLTLDYFCQP